MKWKNCDKSFIKFLGATNAIPESIFIDHTVTLGIDRGTVWYLSISSSDGCVALVRRVDLVVDGSIYVAVVGRISVVVTGRIYVIVVECFPPFS